MLGQAASQLIEHIKAGLADRANGRVLTIVGPNGAGKSKLLREVRNSLAADLVHSLFLPAARRLAFGAPPHPMHPTSLSGDTASAAQGRVLELLVGAGPRGPASPMSPPYFVDPSSAISLMLTSIRNSHNQQIATFKEQLYQFEIGNLPNKPDLPSDEMKLTLNKIGQILGYETTMVQRDHITIMLQFSNGDAVFDVNELSDGEQQILLVSVFLISENKTQFVFLVDEPELYLNEARAIGLWEAIESQFPAAIFVYATHNLTFATRPTVSTTFVLDRDSALSTIDPDSPVPVNIVRNVVGARLQLARTGNPPIFCEDSLSKLLLSDLFRTDDVEIVVAGNWQQVQRAIQGEAGWEAVRSKGTLYCGVIDRDVRSDEEVEALGRGGVFCLPFNDAESLMVIPDVAIKGILRSALTPVSKDAYITALINGAARRLVPTLELLAKHLERFSPSTVQFKVEPLSVTIVPPTDLENQFLRRATEIKQAIASKDVLTILQRFKGKDLYKEIASWARGELDLHLPPKPAQRYSDDRDKLSELMHSLPQFRSFRERVLQRLGLPP